MAYITPYEAEQSVCWKHRIPGAEGDLQLRNESENGIAAQKPILRAGCNRLKQFLTGLSVEDFEIFGVIDGVAAESEANVVEVFDLNKEFFVLGSEAFQGIGMAEDTEDHGLIGIFDMGSEATEDAYDTALNFDAHGTI